MIDARSISTLDFTRPQQKQQKLMPACPHLNQHPELKVLFVSDTHLSIAQAFLKCSACDAHYLIDLVDLAPATSAYRISSLPAQVVAATLHALQKGSCDINRAGAELAFVGSTAQHLGGVLLRQEGDTEGKLWRYINNIGSVQIPADNWRSLPCDGSLISALPGATRGSDDLR